VFAEGECYTRHDINRLLGGSLQSYLPTVNKHVVAACFNAAYDPHAPEIVLVGHDPIIEGTAEQFTTQGNAVPTFLKRGVNWWEYVGNYRVIRYSRDRGEILSLAEREPTGSAT
jgi:phosphohistidine phosphatase SixA